MTKFLFLYLTVVGAVSLVLLQAQAQESYVPQNEAYVSPETEEIFCKHVGYVHVQRPDLSIVSRPAFAMQSDLMGSQPPRLFFLQAADDFNVINEFILYDSKNSNGNATAYLPSSNSEGGEKPGEGLFKVMKDYSRIMIFISAVLGIAVALWEIFDFKDGQVHIKDNDPLKVTDSTSSMFSKIGIMLGVFLK